MTRAYKQRERIDVLDRIMAKVEHVDDCWIFTGAKHRQGYGIIRNDGGSRLVHVIAYQRIIGPVPDRLELDHTCRRSACCNPEHLEPVPHVVNVRRGRQPLIAGRFNASKTHCRNGHEYDQSNTRVRPNGKRDCRACDREKKARKRLAVA